MSRSKHHGCGRHCGVCSPGALELLKLRAAKAPAVAEYEPGVLTCCDCHSVCIDHYPCECGDFDGPDADMARYGFELVTTTTAYGDSVSVTTECWRVPCCEPRCSSWPLCGAK